MKKIQHIKTGVFVLALTLLVGCQTQTVRPVSMKSYKLREKQTSYVGDPFLFVQSGKHAEVKEWVGILFSPTGWETTGEYVENLLRKELIYCGKSGTSIQIQYREYRNSLAANSFYLHLTYDLSESDIIRFQNFLIKVFEADNQKIVFSVAGDGESVM